MNKRWKIWMQYFNHDGDSIGWGIHTRDYAHKRSAVRRAKQLWGANPMVKWIVSQDRPWKILKR